MTMTACRECKKLLSTKAAACPHCGAVRPKPHIGLWLLGGIIGFAFLGSLFTSSTVNHPPIPQSPPTPPPVKPEPTVPRISDDVCMQSSECWGDRHLLQATSACIPLVERQAQYTYEWTDSLLELKFDHYIWNDPAAKTVFYGGDKIRLQNAFGAYENYIYLCDYDTLRGVARAAYLTPGHIGD